MEVTFALYLWAAFWTGVIASRLPEAPAARLPKVLGSIVLGLLWPVSLPMHLYDIKETATDS